MHATGKLLRRLAAPVLCGVALLAAACTTPSGHFCFLGYSTQPNYDPNIHTVRVPIFRNRTYRQGLEFDLTREICHAIERDTPFRVVNGADEQADTELCGTIINLVRPTILASPVNEARNTEATMTVEVTWRDLRTGEVLSRPSRRPGEAPRPEGPGTPPILDSINNPNLPKSFPAPTATPTPPLTPETPVLPTPTPTSTYDGSVKERIVLADGTIKEEIVQPVVIRVSTQYVLEVGQSLTTAELVLDQKAARQITHLMEKPW
jgi:hypothetical protein